MIIRKDKIEVDLQEKRQSKSKEPDYYATVLVGGASLTFILSKDYFKILEVGHGDYIRIVQDGKRLIIEKDA